MKKLFIVFIVSCLFVSVHGQNYEWRSDIETPSETGFYKIKVTPEITSGLSAGYPDIRIYDDNQNEIPYIMETEKPLQRKKMFHEYDVVKKVRRDDWGYTRLIIHNPEKTEISNISLTIRNADVSKWLKLSGSDDNKEWYTVKDKYYFYSMYSDDQTYEIRVINFPLSNYEYYELLVYDYFDNPINILKAGYYDYSQENGKYSVVASPKIFQSDSVEMKKSFVKINFDPSQYLDKLTFDIEGPEFYKRNAELVVRKIRKYRKKESVYFETIKSFELSSNSNNTIHLSGYRAEEIFLVVENNDDKPLIIKNIIGMQLNTHLKAKLEQGKNYYVASGNKDVNPPKYDLKYFESEIPEDIKALVPSAKVSIIGQVSADDDAVKLDKMWIWVIVGFVVLLLVFMSAKMLKEMKKKQ